MQKVEKMVSKSGKVFYYLGVGSLHIGEVVHSSTNQQHWYFEGEAVSAYGELMLRGVDVGTNFKSTTRKRSGDVVYSDYFLTVSFNTGMGFPREVKVV